MVRRVSSVCSLIIAVIIVACARPDWPRDSDSARGDELGECSPGPSGRFVITGDSVGPFSIAGTTMGEVIDSCGAADTAWMDRCCYMSMIARVQYPGVRLEADQTDTGEKLMLLSEVRQWEVEGDSVYLGNGRLLPKTISELAAVGRGYAIHPTYDDNDGPQAFICELPRLTFRLAMGTAQTERAWVIDSSEFNRRIRIAGVLVSSDRRKEHCQRVLDTLKTRR